eukprot:3220543-Prymnesium_polylepis.1
MRSAALAAAAYALSCACCRRLCTDPHALASCGRPARTRVSCACCRWQLNPYFDDVSVTFGPTTTAQLHQAHQRYARPRLIVPMRAASTAPHAPAAASRGAASASAADGAQTARERARKWTEGWAPFPAHTTHVKEGRKDFLALTALSEKLAQGRLAAKIGRELAKGAAAKHEELGKILKAQGLEYARPGLERQPTLQAMARPAPPKPQKRERTAEEKAAYDKERMRRQIERDAHGLLTEALSPRRTVAEDGVAPPREAAKVAWGT